jgi:uncharacterized membrane protein
MSEVPVQLIIAAFRDEDAASQALKTLKQAKKDGLIRIKDAAVIRKDEKGKLRIKETADVGGGKGAAFGGVVGAAIGLVAGPLLVVPAAVGALIGGLTAKLVDTGFSDERLKQIGEALEPGSSAIIAVVEHKWVEEVRREMENAGADLMTEAIKTDIAEQLEAGHDVAYTAISTQEGFSAQRVAGNETEIEGSAIFVTDDEVVGERYVATDKGFAVIAAEADSEGVTVVGAEGTFEEEKIETDSEE